MFTTILCVLSLLMSFIRILLTFMMALTIGTTVQSTQHFAQSGMFFFTAVFTYFTIST